MKNITIVYKIAGICILMFNTLGIQALPQIVVTLKPSTNQTKEIAQTDFERALQKPGKVGQTLLRYGQHTPLQEGIFATYWGYLSVSNFNGVISFIRHTVKPEVKVVITQMIEPRMMFGATVHHWELKPGIPAALYRFKRTDNKPAAWNIKKLPLDYNKPISLDTIVLFANPTKIYVPTGEQPARKDPNLILPPLFAQRGIAKTANALRVLTIKHFFSPVRRIEKKVNNTYYSTLLKP